MSPPPADDEGAAPAPDEQTTASRGDLPPAPAPGLGDLPTDPEPPPRAPSARAGKAPSVRLDRPEKGPSARVDKAPSRRAGRRSDDARPKKAPSGGAPRVEPRRAGGGATPASDPAPPEPIDQETRRLDMNAVVAGGDSETRRFDPDALAAVSARPPRTPLLSLLGFVALTLLVAGVVKHLRGPAEEPAPDLPAPVTDELPPDEATEAEVVSAGPATEAPPDPWPQAQALAAALLEQERYRDALALVDKLPFPTRAAHGAEVRALEERLRALEQFRAAAERALRDASILRAAGRLEEAANRIAALLEAHAPHHATPTGARVEAERRALREAADAAAAAADPTPPPEPEARAAAFERAAARGREVLQALQARIRRDKARLVELRRAEAARAREASQRDPLEVEVAPGYVVKKAVVEALDERGFTLRAAGTDDSVARGWDQVAPEVALRIRRLAARDGVADDQVRLGRWCLVQHQFEEARQAFQRAVQLDPRVMDQVPDVGQFARAGRLFGGTCDRSAGALDVTWTFDRAAEAGDWEDEEGSRGVMRDGRLEVRGKQQFFTALKDVGWEERLVVEATLGPASRDATVAVGVSFQWGTRREGAWFAAVNKANGDLLLLARRDGRLRVVDKKPGLLKDDSPAVTLEVADGHLRVKALRRTQLKVDVDPTWERVRVLLGGTAPADGAASVERLAVRGGVRAAWLRKATGEVDAMLRAALARTDELPVFAEPPGRPAAADLSAEDAYGLADVPAQTLEDHRAGRIKATSRDPVDLLAAAAAFDRALERTPRFAAAHHRRALVLEALGRAGAALADLEQAVARCPRFFEAMAQRSRLLALAGQLDEAERLADRAVELRPDHAPAHAARGIAAFCRGDLEKAGEALELAQALDPWDDGVRGLRRNVAHVLAGPPWSRTFKVETDHYVVLTDISARRGEEYARDLEAVRAYYAARFGRDDPPLAGPRKAKVLIFDTREGFHSYAELTTDDRVESMLGYYLPRYRQLLLYEDKADATLEETRRVLYHEGFHQFVDGLVQDLPPWVNEGLAEYFGASVVDDGRVVRHGGLHEDRLRDLRRFVGSGQGPVPFGRVMLEGPREFYSGPLAAKYAQVWSMAHFFEHGAQGETRDRWRRYMTLLRNGTPARRAHEEAWGGVAWDEVQAAWLTWVKALK